MLSPLPQRQPVEGFGFDGGEFVQLFLQVKRLLTHESADIF